MFQARKMTFPSFEKCKCFCQLSHLAVSLWIDIIARFVSFFINHSWSVKRFDQPQLKFRSVVLRIALIGKFSVEWPQASFLWVPAVIFPGGETSTFCLYFSGCWQCNALGRSQSASPFLHKKELLDFTAIVTKMHFVGNNSQVYIAISYKDLAQSNQTPFE